MSYKQFDHVVPQTHKSLNVFVSFCEKKWPEGKLIKQQRQRGDGIPQGENMYTWELGTRLLQVYTGAS